MDALIEKVNLLYRRASYFNDKAEAANKEGRNPAVFRIQSKNFLEMGAYLEAMMANGKGEEALAAVSSW